MKISVVASTKLGYQVSKQELDEFGGKSAGICYLPSTFEALLNEDPTKTERRANQTKNSGHHSVYDHGMINLYLEEIPKGLAMVLNNEQFYVTSEKSARYTKMVLDADVQKLYDKWIENFKGLIEEKYAKSYPNFFTPQKIEKLAQENARYLTSVFTPTSMEYSTSYRQLNYIYNFMQKEINNEKSNKFYAMLKPAMQDFCKAVENLGYIDERLIDGKNRNLSLFSTRIQPAREYFGNVYTTNYKASFAQVAQAQRHRTLSYSITLLDEPGFYVPPILKVDTSLVKEWEMDCMSQLSKMPQGLLVNVNESGSYDKFILKMMERNCTFAQLEINQQTTATANKYYNALVESEHPLADDMKNYLKGSRCTFPGYKCQTPCGFKEGVNQSREI